MCQGRIKAGIYRHCACGRTEEIDPKRHLGYSMGNYPKNVPIMNILRLYLLLYADEPNVEQGWMKLEDRYSGLVTHTGRSRHPKSLMEQSYTHD